MLSKQGTLFLLLLLIFAQTANSQEKLYRGFRMGLHFGGYLPLGNTANYFNGTDGNENNLKYVMSQPTFYDSIYYYTNAHDTVFVKELPLNMNYQVTINPGLYGEYVFNKSTALSFEFNYMMLQLKDAVSFEVDPIDEVLTQPDIRLYPIKGTEKRIYFNIGMRKNFETKHGYSWFINSGLNINNTKVIKSAVFIEGHEFSLINYYGNQVIVPGQSQTFYVNQGGLGFGAFVGGGAMFHISSITFEPGLIAHWARVNLEGYKSFNPGIGIYLRFIFDGGAGKTEEE